MYTEILYILDRSGSMSSIWTDAVGGLKTFIEEQQKVDGECNFTLSVFDTEFDNVVSHVDLQSLQNFDIPTIQPRNMTALHDAIGKTVQEAGEVFAKQERKPEKVICVIMTDGLENASKEWTRAQIADMIQHQESRYGWEFIFAGADFDAHAVGGTLNIKREDTHQWDKTSAGTRAAFADISMSVVSKRRG